MTFLVLRTSIGNSVVELAPNLRVNDATSSKDYYFRTFGYDPNSIEELDNGRFSCLVLQKYKEQKPKFFPKDWTWEKIKQAIKDTYEKGQYDKSKGPITCKVYAYPENNIRTRIFLKSNKSEVTLVMCYAE